MIGNWAKLLALPLSTNCVMIEKMNLYKYLHYLVKKQGVGKILHV